MQFASGHFCLIGESNVALRKFVISQDSLLANNEGINALISHLLAGRYDLAGFIEAMDAKVRQIYAEKGI